ncbi:tetratricopeptide repeat protein [Shewanella sp. GXUN23E]|uniref:tetratricopeptide repeat protein n=1 Tax=Shewanella sp. GXUN23E TaxID=3422498 RepID=UPI003D7ED951
MFELGSAIAVTLGGFLLMLWRHHVRWCRSENVKEADTSYRVWYWILMSLALLIVSLGQYAAVGRFSDWNSGKPDRYVDYLAAAEITRARQQAEKTPDDAQALLVLAQSSVNGGMYAEAVTALDRLLTLQGERADILGMKATAMYYRDKRSIAPETGIVIARALALHREELQTRLLLATDAYLKGQYAKAINHWQILLQNQTQLFDHEVINNAISKATGKLNQQTEPDHGLSN